MVTGFVDFDVAIVADGFEELEERNVMFVEAGPCLIGANVLDENGSGGESREKKALPEALASLQPLVSRFPHSVQQLKLTRANFIKLHIFIRTVFGFRLGLFFCCRVSKV